MPSLRRRKHVSEMPWCVRDIESTNISERGVHFAHTDVNLNDDGATLVEVVVKADSQ